MLRKAVTLRAGNKKEARKMSPERKNNKRKEVYSYGVTEKGCIALTVLHYLRENSNTKRARGIVI